MDSASGSGLREFLDWAGSKGELNQTTARALKGATGKVLQVEDDPENVDIRSVQVEDILRRFETRFRTSYTTGSMATYKTRFRQAVDMYLAWLDNDPRWKTVVRSRRVGDRAQRRASSIATLTATESVSLPSQPMSLVGSEPRQTSSQLVTYDLPLRPDLLVQIELPVRLTRADADRVAAFVKSLAFDDSSDASVDEHPLTDLDDEAGDE